jgi:hypothetical protein
VGVPSVAVPEYEILTFTFFGAGIDSLNSHQKSPFVESGIDDGVQDKESFGTDGEPSIKVNFSR